QCSPLFGRLRRVGPRARMGHHYQGGSRSLRRPRASRGGHEQRAGSAVLSPFLVAGLGSGDGGGPLFIAAEALGERTGCVGYLARTAWYGRCRVRDPRDRSEEHTSELQSRENL